VRCHYLFAVAVVSHFLLLLLVIWRLAIDRQTKQLKQKSLCLFILLYYTPLSRAAHSTQFMYLKSFFIARFINNSTTLKHNNNNKHH
jgi:hypothetical protein